GRAGAERVAVNDEAGAVRIFVVLEYEPRRDAVQRAVNLIVGIALGAENGEMGGLLAVNVGNVVIDRQGNAGAGRSAEDADIFVIEGGEALIADRHRVERIVTD